jgi:hypothetical protein
LGSHKGFRFTCLSLFHPHPFHSKFNFSVHSLSCERSKEHTILSTLIKVYGSSHFPATTALERRRELARARHLFRRQLCKCFLKCQGMKFFIFSSDEIALIGRLLIRNFLVRRFTAPKYIDGDNDGGWDGRINFDSWLSQSFRSGIN